MLNIKCYDDKTKEVFEKYLKLTGLSDDYKFYGGVREIESDVKFFQSFINRMPKNSHYNFEPKLTFGGTHDGFSRAINREFNYYDYDLLPNYIYVYEIARILFSNHWVQQTGPDPEVVKQIAEFHIVVKYYFQDFKQIHDYYGIFIGSAYGCTEFDKVFNSITQPLTH